VRGIENLIMGFLFDPIAASNRLASLPYLRQAVSDPQGEGEPSGVFSTARKSQREIYRVLGNIHYRHLDQLLETLDRCLEYGFAQPTILRTRARKPFSEALAELHVAEHFLLREFAIVGTDAIKGQEAVPDFIASGYGLELAVEVYCPRVWEGLAYLLDDLKDLLKNLDLPYEYEFAARAEQLMHFNGGRLIQLHPNELSDLLTPPVREQLRCELVAELTRGLGGSGPQLAIERERTDLNLTLSVELTSVAASAGPVPSRYGTLVGPGITGYAPEGIFDHLVNRKVREKARKRQAVEHRSRSLSLLVVDLSHSELLRELGYPLYCRLFAEILDRRLGSGLEGYDLIAFCDTPGWHRELRLHFLMREKRVAPDVARMLFCAQVL
jgi:hypothetical protein